MIKKIEKIVGKLSGFERISICVTVFYCLGIVIRMQSEILYGLPSFVEINRALPFAVTTQYLLFLFVPFVSFILPYRLSRPFLNSWIRVLVWISTSLFFIVAFPMMLHYFIPFTARLMPDGVSYWGSWAYTIENFWRLYFSWASHLLGFGFLLIAYILPSSYPRNAVFKKDVSLKWVRLLLLIFGVLTNIFYFNSSVYCNISQGVFGAARSYGILTIQNPPQSLLDEYYDAPSRYPDEFSFPCSIEGRTADWLIVSKGKNCIADFTADSTDPSKGGLMAIKMSDVRMFNPIQWCSYKLDDEEKMIESVFADSIYRMDVQLGILCAVTNGDNTVALASSVRADKQSKLGWFIGGTCIGGAEFCRVNPVITDSTNVVVNVVFPQVAFSGLRTLDDLTKILRNQCVSIRVEGFSEIIAPYEPLKMSVGLCCNFWAVQKVPIDNYKIEPNGSAWLFSTSIQNDKVND